MQTVLINGIVLIKCYRNELLRRSFKTWRYNQWHLHPHQTPLPSPPQRISCKSECMPSIVALKLVPLPVVKKWEHSFSLSRKTHFPSQLVSGESFSSSSTFFELILYFQKTSTSVALPLRRCGVIWNGFFQRKEALVHQHPQYWHNIRCTQTVSQQSLLGGESVLLNIQGSLLRTDEQKLAKPASGLRYG